MAPTMQTRHRLYVSMGISAIAIAAILALCEWLIGFSPAVLTPSEPLERLTVLVMTDDRQPVVEAEAPGETAAASSQAASVYRASSEARQDLAALPAPALPVEAEPITDWHAAAKTAARASIEDYTRNEEARAAMWRESRSIMFAPDPDFLLVAEEEPVISDIRFKPEIHVFGIGVTIGSCFVGIPILGVPVEQRSAAINLFVCASDPG